MMADDRRLPSEIPRRRASGGTHRALGEARESLLFVKSLAMAKAPPTVSLVDVILQHYCCIFSREAGGYILRRETRVITAAVVVCSLNNAFT